MKPPFASTLRRTTKIALVAVLLAFACGGRGQTDKVDGLFAPWNKPDSPGAAVVIIHDGAVVYQQGYGSANLELRVPITPQTRFDVASVAKQFAGLAVAKLVHEGRLSLEDDVRQHLPDVPDFGKTITLGHLVRHTSGLRDWPETLGLAGHDMQGTITLETILEMVRRQRELDFPPGEKYQYSNTGYNLLAATVAKVTGQSFRAWSDAQILQPLGLKATFVCDNPAEVMPNTASSYGLRGPGKFQRINSLLSAQGSSSVFTSVEDLGQWLLSFDLPRASDDPAIALMHQPGKLNDGTRVSYGFGIGIGQNRGVRSVSHTGSWAGYRSITLRFPEKRFAVGILANAANIDTMHFALTIAEYYGIVPPVPPAERPTNAPAAAFKADPGTWDGFPGTYRLGPGWLLTITREGDALMTQATREPKFKMTPIADRRFLVPAYNNSGVEFVGETAGPATHLRYRGITAPRVELLNLTAERLAAYVGEYWSEELRTITRLEIHDGKLAIRQRSGAWVHFTPTEIDRFDPEGGSMALAFTRNAKSEVTEVKLTGGRVRNLRYVRVALVPGSTTVVPAAGGSRD